MSTFCLSHKTLAALPEPRKVAPVRSPHVSGTEQRCSCRNILRSPLERERRECLECWIAKQMHRGDESACRTS